MNLLCEVPNSNILIRVPVPPEHEKSVSDFTYFWKSLNAAFEAAKENDWEYTYRQTHTTVHTMHWDTISTVYRWLSVLLKKIKSLNNLPDTINNNIHPYIEEPLPVRFCEESQINLMDGRWGSKVTIIDYSELL